MIDRLAKFNELVPSSLPFVEGRLEGHKERKNYTIIGRGVAEDTKQLIKIQSLHGYNLGAVSAMPKNGSGLHSHTTAEVFVIYSGKWRFYWGADGKQETILEAGDIISMPTNMFRAFENVGDKESLMFVVLGGDDPGIITWVPEILKKAKETGMALLDDNSLIDLKKVEVPNGRKMIEPITQDELEVSKATLDQSLTMQRSLNIKPELEASSDSDLKEKLLNHPQKDFWHEKMIWYGPSGIGTARSLEGFIDHHQLPFRKTFKERNYWELGHYCELGDGKFSLTAGWHSIQAVYGSNDWLGYNSNKNKVTMRVMDFYHHDEGKIRENWVPIDLAHILSQIGVDIFK